MKKLINAFLALAAGLAIAGCAKEYDDSALQSKVNDLDKKVTELEKKVNALTEQVTGLATTIDEWKKGGFVESVTDIKEGDAVIGYTVTFVGGKTVVLYNGKDGKNGEPGAAGEDGATPTIILYEGNLVWAIGTEPILVDGKPVPANVVPTFTINDEGHLIMTLQGQETDLGKVKGEDGAAGAGGDSILKSIEKSADGKNLVFTLNGDPEVVYEIPFATAFKLVIEKTEQEVKAGETVKIPFTIENGEGAVVDCFPGGYYSAKIEDNNVVVTVPDPFFPGHVLVWAQNDKGLYSMVKLSFITTADVVVVTPADEIEAIPAAAGDFVINLTSNVDLDAKIPEDATWISKAEVTKADYKLTLTLEENTTGEPREAEISIVRKDNGQEVKTVKIVQLASTGPVAKKDVLNNAFTGIDNSGSSYQEWSDKAGTSGAIYIGKSARGAAADNLSIQLRANGDEGIVTTTTGGLVKKINVKWNSSAAAKRYLDVYGSNTAYTAVSDLYSLETRGTLLGSIVRTTTEDTEGTIEVEGDYAYIGFRSRASAMYIDEITVTWDEGTPSTPETPSYNWDFSAAEWQAKFAEYGEAGTDITGWNIMHDGLQIVSIVDKSKYQTDCFQMGGKATLANNAVVERYFSFVAPTDGYVMVVSSNTSDAEAATRMVNVANNSDTPVDKMGGFPTSDIGYNVFEVKAGRVAVYPTGDGLRFYKILFSETDPTPKAPALVKVWGLYGEAGVCGWPGKVAGVEDLDGNIRNATFDDDFVYIPKTKAVKDESGDNFTEYKIFKFSTTDGSYKGLVTPATDPAYMAGTWASTFPVSCARVMKNTDPSINGGKDVLVCTNLCDGQNVRLYAWENGIDQQPKLITNFTSSRRFGDRISVEGTYTNGRVWYRSFAAGITAYINLVPGYTSGFNGSHAWNWVEGIGATATDDGDNMITEYTSFSNGAYGIVSSNSGSGIYLLTGTATTKTYADYKRCFGWHAFEFNGKNYLAYLDMSTGTDKPIVTILEGASDSVANLQATLDAKTVAFRAAFATADTEDFTTGTAYATNNVGDCQVRIIDGTPYILGATRGSMALFKLVLE